MMRSDVGPGTTGLGSFWTETYFNCRINHISLENYLRAKYNGRYEKHEKKKTFGGSLALSQLLEKAKHTSFFLSGAKTGLFCSYLLRAYGSSTVNCALLPKPRVLAPPGVLQSTLHSPEQQPQESDKSLQGQSQWNNWKKTLPETELSFDPTSSLSITLCTSMYSHIFKNSLDLCLRPSALHGNCSCQVYEGPIEPSQSLSFFNLLAMLAVLPWMSVCQGLREGWDFFLLQANKLTDLWVLGKDMRLAQRKRTFLLTAQQ